MLERGKADIVRTRIASREPLSDPEVHGLLKNVDEVIVARGKSRRVISADEATLDDLRGPTGNFRAPLLKSGRLLLVGFDEETMKKMLTR